MTEFSSDYQPKKRKRGPNKRTLFIDALKKKATSEEAFYEFCVDVAMGTHSYKDDSNEFVHGKPDNQMLKEILARLSPLNKQTLPTYDFEFPSNGTKVQKAESIVNAIGEGILPIDAAKLMMDLLESAASIEEKEELSERVNKLEELLNAQGNS